MKYFLVCMVILFSFCQGAVAVTGTQSVVPQSGLTSSLTIQLEPIGPLRLDSGNGAPWWSYFVPIVGPILSGALAFFGVWLGLRIGAENTLKTTQAGQMNNDAAIWQKANETELRDIQARLDGFYIPFQLLSKANHQFAQDLRSRQEPGYRMLMKLFDADWLTNLSPGDKKLVEIVCNNGEELRALIAGKSGLVDDSILPYLSRASAHFRILHLAYKSELGGDAARFSQYVYPRELDGVLALEVNRLRARVGQLRKNPGGRPEAFEPLVIPQTLDLPEWVDPDGRSVPVAPVPAGS